MADDFVSLADMVTLNDTRVADIEGMSDLLDDAPFIKSLYAMGASNGTDHKYLKETGAPTVGFRAVNAGRDWDSSQDTLVEMSLKLLDGSFGIDKALAMTYRKGGSDALMAMELKRHLKAMWAMAEGQLIYGDDAAGFSGLADIELVDTGADAMAFDAEGTTAGSATSVWLIRTGETDCALIAGNDGTIDVGDVKEETIIGSNSKKMPALTQSVLGWMGLQVGTAYSIARIINITEETGKTLTDDMIYKALALFPASRQPNRIVMNRRSLEQLRSSRTATSTTGTPAARPTDVDGVQIIVTDHIVSTEDVYTASSS